MGEGWVVGVCINLVGSIMINLGTNVMKMGHNRLAAISASPSRPQPAIYKMREWQIGVSLFSLGNVANFVSFGYAAQSLLAAIGCVQFVSNVVFASWVLKEQVSKAVLAATACIVAGCVLLVSGGSHVSEKYTYRELLRLYAAPAYISYMSVGGAAVLLAYAGYWFGSKAVMSKGPEAARVWTAALPILYSIFSALIGTQSVLFSKTLAVLLRSTVAGDNQLNKWFTWFVLVAFLTTAVFWVTRLNKGLRMFPALVIVPSLQICWTLFSILSGMLYFHEYQGMRAGPTAMFVVGVAVVFAGVFLLTRASQPSTAGAGQPAELKPLQGSSARITYVKDDARQALRPAHAAASDDPQRELAAVRANTERSQVEPAGMQLRGAPQLLCQHEADQADAADADADDASDEEEYERALLACTSGRCGGRSSSHLTAQQQQQQSQQQWGACAAAGGGGSGAAAAAPADPQQGRHLGADGQRLRGTKQRWMSKASSLKRRVALDFSLDETAAAKLTLGLGDSHTPGFSLFTMPMVDVRELPHETSSWRSAELVGGRSYGRLPETSTGGCLTPRLRVPSEHDETGCISSQGGAVPAAGAAAAMFAIKRSSSAGCFLDASFTWPPVRSAPSEPALPVAGPFASINPLANAIDLRSVGNSKAPSRLVSQEEAPAAAAASSKWKVLQRAISANVQELKATIAGNNNNGGSDGGAGGRQQQQGAVVVVAASGSPMALRDRSSSSDSGGDSSSAD